MVWRAQTLHRLLEIAGGGLAELDGEKRSASAGLGMHFNRDQENPLEADVIIVDEMSMVDINIMNALLKGGSCRNKTYTCRGR